MLRKDGFSGLIPLHEVAPEALAWVEQFESGRPKLDAFLKEEAKDLHDDNLSRTSLIFHEDFQGVVGYITLANDGIPLTMFEVGELGLRNNYSLRDFPAVKICRLAVNSQLRRQGVGRLIVNFALGQIIESHKITSARLLVADAVNEPDVLAFYTSMGFFDSGWANEQADKAEKRGPKDARKGQQQRETIKMLRDIYGTE
ncbi:GNAT family N-acetyltransferase [Pseudoduganella sp. LjRoot289]|uniref:GNAT family N-acetyltransferase n=1 Tax=Pseudoduganella sp. LjRoot289 TaxID=3342314 RepID=UPI003ED10715